jgi:hypothetical protein
MKNLPSNNHYLLNPKEYKMNLKKMSLLSAPITMAMMEITLVLMGQWMGYFNDFWNH